jgi:hypothetical protein
MAKLMIPPYSPVLKAGVRGYIALQRRRAARRLSGRWPTDMNGVA